MTTLNRRRRGKAWLGAALCAALVTIAQCPLSWAQLMTDYTNMPIFLNQSVPPNILFLVDMGNYTLEAAYSGSNQRYYISFKAGTAADSKYSSNVTIDSATGDDLVAADNNGAAINTSNVTSPADTFDPNKSYYGMFDPLRCYTTDSNSFNYASTKTAVSNACGTSYWDGNFMNWLTARKKETIYQVLVGGEPIPAQANQDGTANTLDADPKTGEDGSTNDCNSNSKSCWRYVKFVPSSILWPGTLARIPYSMAATTVSLNGGGTVSSGVFIGVGEGKVYVNDNATASPFDNAVDHRFTIEVDLLTEPNTPSGTNSYADNCTLGDPLYAGHLVCYQRDRSLGLFQKMRTDNMHVAVMFINASTGQGGSLQFGFDDNFNASSVTNIRNEHLASYTPISEALYEGLCLYRKSQGPCYSNSGSWSTGYSSGGTGAAGDPFYFVSMGQSVRCCKSFVLMISPGRGTSDGNAPDLQSPFGNLFTGTNIGVTSTGDAGDRLDDVAYYGRTHDLRSDLGGNQTVAFYAVNAMGGPTGAALLASAAKYGGFEDRNNDNAVDLTGSQACTFPAGSKLGSGTSTSNAEWDLDKDCVPDTYFDASEGGDLEAQINKAIADILKRAASGTALSVLASSSTGEGTIYQAFFYPSTFEGANEIKWTGFVEGLWLDPYGNLREDRGGSAGGGDGRLTYAQDNIIRTRLDTTTGDVRVDRYLDVSPADGIADSATPYETVGLREIQGIWEGGKGLALRDLSTSPRNIFTWVDTDNDGVVDSGEQIEFSTANAATLAPYLRANATGTFTAINIINFIHGTQISGMRDRQLTVNGSLRVWKLGDIVNSTPTIIGPPVERFDVLYGDRGYANFLLRWKNRRQVAYVGGNDGMMHAFNVGYYHRGDDPSTTAVEHGWFTTAPTDNSSGPAMGEELWGFIPYTLLPQLKWLTETGYTHVSYVDLRPKVTDVPIFTPEAACGGGSTPDATGCIHPNGWGTIMIVGLRFGGSCGSCTTISGGSGGGPPLHLVADFNGNGNTTDVNDDRYFYSGYFVLDITDPSATPTLLMAYTGSTIGLPTSYPTVVRMSPPAPGPNSGKTDHSYAKLYMVFGSGPHGYDGRVAAKGKVFAVQLTSSLGTAPASEIMNVDPTSTRNGYMGDPTNFDRDLDFRTDIVYIGQTYDDTGGNWRGKMFRITLGSCADTTCTLPAPTKSWGIVDTGSLRKPTVVLNTFLVGATSTQLGPIATKPAITMDDSGNAWIFFGTGRFISAADKTDSDQQQLLGVKDPVMRGSAGCTQSTEINCYGNNLLDVTTAQVCVSCSSGTQVSGVGTATTFTQLLDLIKGTSSVTAKDGWFILLPVTSGKAERSIVDPTLLGGAVFFPTFIPDSDPCVSAGASNVWAMYYLTGTAYTQPIIGASTTGVSNRTMSLGDGLASSVAVQAGAQPTGAGGFVNNSNALVLQFNFTPPVSIRSQFISWLDLKT